MDLSYAKDGLPFLFEHDREVQVGKVHGVRVDGDGLIRGEIEMGHHPDASWIEMDIRAGIRSKVSIAYDPGEEYEVTPPEVKGGVPTRTYRGWMLYEGSTVSIPADYDHAGIGRSRAVARNEAAYRQMQDDGPGAAPGGAAPTVDTGAPAHREVAMAAPVKPEATPPMGAGVNADAERQAIRAQEQERVKTLRSLARIHGLQERADTWITDGLTVEAAIEQVRTAQEAGETGSAEGFIRSGAGPRQRDGSLKEFESRSEFFGAVHRAAQQGARPDPRLRAVTGQSEGVGADGGFAIPAEMLTTILEPAYTTGALLSRVNRIPITNGNSIKYPVVDETSRAHGSRFGAVTSAWAGEGDQGPIGKVKFRAQELDLKKIIALGRVTDEMLEDLPAADAILTRSFQGELQFRGEDAILNGTGNGQPLGILVSPSFVSQAIEGGQTIANTPANVVANVTKMKSRFPAHLWPQAVWLINQEFEPSLVMATLGGTAAAPVYMPPGGFSAAPYGTILGAPVIPVEYCAAVGTPGDIVLAHLGSYDWAEKAAGPKVMSSAHVRFDFDEMAYRFTWRVDGQPQWRTAVTPYKGALSRTPFVGLATRS